MRVIEYTLNDPERTGHGETHRLATNLFDHTLFPALELACYYHERWEEEMSHPDHPSSDSLYHGSRAA